MDTRPLFSALLIALFLALFSPAASATTAVRFTTKELVTHAERVFHGRCLKAESSYDERGLVVTRYEFEVVEMLKGEAGRRSVSFSQPGGIVGNRGLYIPGVARFDSGREFVVFVAAPARAGQPTYTVGLAQGAFAVRDGDGSGQQTVTRSLDGLELVSGSEGTGRVRAEGHPHAEGEEVANEGEGRTERSLDELLGEVRGLVRAEAAAEGSR